MAFLKGSGGFWWWGRSQDLDDMLNWRRDRSRSTWDEIGMEVEGCTSVSARREGTGTYRQNTEPEPVQGAWGSQGGLLGWVMPSRYPPSVSRCGMLGVRLEKPDFDLCFGPGLLSENQTKGVCGLLSAEQGKCGVSKQSEQPTWGSIYITYVCKLKRSRQSQCVAPKSADLWTAGEVPGYSSSSLGKGQSVLGAAVPPYGEV
ncbi:hypothetical protein B0T21DRAFT_343880 [Apiosordaria backusii]|uniref:Uncharacterized protein n=1 Tax=Apiosordaria backusii TaxID=314023 RepID=A0AA40EZ29_9PEZI|nr:hypothetical protein B0T21DRAFT_343880 [Apiosordaria backusii]